MLCQCDKKRVHEFRIIRVAVIGFTRATLHRPTVLLKTHYVMFFIDFLYEYMNFLGEKCH